MVNFVLALDTQKKKKQWNPAVGLFDSSVHTAKHTGRDFASGKT
jgi:hypothetical protein